MQPPAARYRDWPALGFAMFFPLMMSYTTFILLDAATDRGLLRTFGIGKVFQFAFPALYVFWFERDDLRFVWPSWHGVPIGVGFALIVGGLMFPLYYLLVRHIPGVEETPRMIFNRLQHLDQATPARYLGLAIFICVPHALLEEYYWRWFVFGWLRRSVPMWAAILLSSIGFMLHHVVILSVYFPGNFWTLALPLSLCVAVGGGVWAWLYDRTGTIYAGWLSHCLIDSAIVILGYCMMWDLFHPPLVA